MAVLAWMGLGLVTAVLASGFRRGLEERGVLAGRYVTGAVGGLLGGLIAVAAGVGSMADFIHTGTWLVALGGAVLAIFVYELARSMRGRPELPGRRGGSWVRGKAGGESERHDRNG